MAKGRSHCGESAWSLRHIDNKIEAYVPDWIWSASMSELQIVKMDEGGVNARILARETKADFRRVEAASLKIPTRFNSAEGKRFFVRHFNTLQLNVHFISVIARTRLDHAEIEQIETSIRTRMETATANLNKAIDGAEALFKSHGVFGTATYDTVPLDVQVGVLSSSGRRFLELLVKLDQVMPVLQTLEIHEVISAQAVDTERASLKRQVRDVANGARNLAMGLRRRMNALDARDGGEQGLDTDSPAAEALPEAPVSPEVVGVRADVGDLASTAVAVAAEAREQDA